MRISVEETIIQKDLTWPYRMNSIVKYTASGWEEYLGRNVHMSGTIEWYYPPPPPPALPEGEAPGIFRIN
jgi:hypothetical protein